MLCLSLTGTRLAREKPPSEGARGFADRSREQAIEMEAGQVCTLRQLGTRSRFVQAIGDEIDEAAKPVLLKVCAHPLIILPVSRASPLLRSCLGHSPTNHPVSS